MSSLVVPAPAKVNLFLHVTGRRSDGYHTLESLFVLVDIADTLSLTLRDDGAVRRTNDVASVPAADDLALRAAHALQRASGTRLGVDYALDKRIPIGAGLGGGSSDAATMLLALDRLWSLGWSRDALAGIALSLGADVPFFIGGEPALARGIGEALEPMSVPPLWLVVAVPSVHVPTAAIFAARELTRDTPSAKMNVFSAAYGRNDLEPVAAARFPEVAAALTSLRRVAPHARMSGSGAAVFASFESEHDARAAASQVPSASVVRTLARHPLASFA
ncbi:MAG TPA: 4-(cytidine 5'-diphospho)-2-C-methyl-D-erythritol kinase [Casimicrobiaceae bacterium]|jgi:4-diphosphocytidyl-2-C-methyl-D-erythritol kinase